MSLIWIVVAFFVYVVGYGQTEWDVMKKLLEDNGADSELLAFVAGYTFPLTLATFIVVVALLNGAHRGVNPYGVLFAIAGTMWVAGWLAATLRLGLLPDQSIPLQGGGHPAIRAFLTAFQSYFNTYGASLMFCSLAIGAAAALQVRKWQVAVE